MMDMMDRREMLRRVGTAAGSAAAATLLTAAPEARAQTAEEKPFRLGVAGSDNSHAAAFGQLANRPEGRKGVRIEGVRVTHIYGEDKEQTIDRAESGQIPNIVEKPEDMIGQVDGVAVVYRHGSKHLAGALPFLEAGIPVFVDKPLAASVEDARKLVAAAQKAGVGFSSHSTLRYADSTREFIQTAKEELGEFKTGMVTGYGNLEDQYDGLIYYGIHTIELINAVWGYGCKKVLATQQNLDVIATCKLENGAIVAANFMPKAGWHHVLLFSETGWKHLDIDDPTAYRNGMQVFIEAMKTGTCPMTPEQLLEPIKINAAVLKSLKEGREVDLEEV